MTSHVKSSSAKSMFEMDKAASKSMKKAWDASASVSGSYAGVSGSASVQGSGESSKDESRKESRSNAEESSSETSEILFAVKGGQAGLSPDLWRQSLLENSNWAVTDRAIDMCIPHWDWLRSASGDEHCLRQHIFDVYYRSFLPFTKAPAGDVDDFVQDLSRLYPSLGKEAGAACGGVSNDQEARDESCQQPLRCLQAGQNVTYGRSTFQSTLGCRDHACCTNPPAAGSLKYGDKGCQELAPAGQQPGKLCETHFCDVTALPSVCACPPRYKLDVTGRKCVCRLKDALGQCLPTVFIRTATGADWVHAVCPDGSALIGGGCDTTGSPHIFQFSMPNEKARTWTCGGHGSSKTAYAICSTTIEVSYTKVTSGDWTTAECPAGQQVMGGGCASDGGANIFETNTAEADGNSKWRCGGGGGKKEVIAICVNKTMQLQRIEQDTTDWANVKCPVGMVIVGGGCDAFTEPHKMWSSYPASESEWRCGGHGGDKKVMAICAYP